MGFRKAAPAQAAVKMSMYGPPGSGKTFSALLFAEGLAKSTGKRIAFVDTEKGTDFYAVPVPERKAHPEAFDFDALYTRSLSEVLKSVKALKPSEHSVVVLDSVTHLWETAINSYTGPKTKAGTIPMWAWGKIKAPYKELMKFLIDSPYHVFILGRQGNAFEEDADTGEVKAVGFKMKAEGETAYEPHVCLHMEPQRDKKTGGHLITAFAEKDRSGILACRVIEWPDFDRVIKPLLGIMGLTQGATPDDEEAAAQDAEARGKADREKTGRSKEILRKFKGALELAETKAEADALNAKLTPALKKEMHAAHVDEARGAYFARLAVLQGHANGRPDEQHQLEPEEVST